MLVAMPQLLVTAGTCAGYFTCYGTIRIAGEMQWRLPFIIQVAGGGVLALVCYLLPQSPRWLLIRADTQTAVRNMTRLDFPQEEVEDDPRASLEDATDEPTMRQKSLSWDAVVDLFRKKHRFRTSLALFILGMVQLCGIDGVLYVCSA